MRYNKYDINKLDYIKIFTRYTDGIAYLNENKDCYIDITRNSISSYRNERVYKVKNTEKICSLNDILYQYDLWLLLLDPKGELKKEITEPRVSEVLHLFKNISTLNDNFFKKMHEIIDKIVKICTENIGVKDDNFSKLLRSYIFIEMMINGEGEKTLIINKQDNLLDYKIMRLLKYLKIDIDIKDIPNFKIEYSLEKISYYDKNNNLSEFAGLTNEQKIKILI